MTRILLVLNAIWLLFAAPSAMATVYSVQWCFEFDTAFTDRSGGDYWTSASDRTADGIRITISPINGFPTVQEFASDPGGCAYFSMNDAYDYVVYAESLSEVNGVTISVWDDDVNPARYLWMPYDWANPYSPYDDRTETHDIPFDTNTAMQAVATRMLGMNNFGLGSTTPDFDYYDDDCCNAGGSGMKINASITSQTVIGHETGHAILKRRDEATLPSYTYNADEFSCDGDGRTQNDHGQVTREWQSAAAYEGLADTLSAWSWNDTSESDCVYDRNSTSDFDLNGTDDNNLAPINGFTNCEGVPASGIASYVTVKDWLADLATAGDPAGCTGSVSYVSSQLDWLRYGWDMLSDQNVDILYLVDIFDLSNARTWDPNGYTPFVDVFADQPTNRWEWAADNHPLTFGAEHDAEKDNGQDH